MVDIGENDVLLIPVGLEKGRKYPMIVFLHGAGGTALEMEKVVSPLVDAWEYFVFLPTGSVVRPARRDVKLVRDWDPFLDVTGVIGKIETLVKHHEIDPSLIFISGFSSGATMSYVVGFARPDLFCGLIPFCGTLQGDLIDRRKFDAASAKLHICIVHGWHDPGVPWLRASTANNMLHTEGFMVKFISFNGGHSFPSNWMDILKEAIEWCHNTEKPA